MAPGTVLELLHHVGVLITQALLVGSFLLLELINTVTAAAFRVVLDTDDFLLHALPLFPEVVFVLDFESTETFLQLHLVPCRLGGQLSLERIDIACTSWDEWGTVGTVLLGTLAALQHMWGFTSLAGVSDRATVACFLLYTTHGVTLV